jgi:hypothetical protein
MAFDYTCQNKALKVKRIIKEYVSWNEKIGEVPSWCPRRK